MDRRGPVSKGPQAVALQELLKLAQQLDTTRSSFALMD